MANGYLSDNKKREAKIKKLIKKYMALRDMDQTDVARKMGRTQQWFSYNLAHASFSLSETAALGKILDIDWSELGGILNE